jgi:glycerol kinase
MADYVGAIDQGTTSTRFMIFDRGGNVIGSTDKEGAFVTDRPVSPADVCHTVYDALGIDPRKELRTAEGRPVAILDQGETVKELCSRPVAPPAPFGVFLSR